MVYEKETWVNVSDPSQFTSEELSSFPRFDAYNMNRIEEGIAEHLQSVSKGGTGATTAKDAANNLMVKSIGGGTEINVNDDLNSYTTVGNYMCTLRTTAETLKNCPITTAFTMTVGYPTGVSVYRYQEITRHDNGVKYFRIYTAGSDTWGDWQSTYGTANKPTSDDIGALSKTTIINGVDILGVSKDGWYYTENCTNTPIPNANGYMRVMKYGDAGNYKMVEWTPNTSHTKYVNIRTNKSGWLGWVETLHTNNISTLGVAQAQTGTYTGTGVDASGYSYPVNLSFNFTPKYVFVKAVNNKGAGGIHYHGHFLYNEKYVAIFNGSSTDNAIATWGNTTLEWKNTKQNYAAWSLNEANQTYSWIAIG